MPRDKCLSLNPKTESIYYSNNTTKCCRMGKFSAHFLRFDFQGENDREKKIPPSTSHPIYFLKYYLFVFGTRYYCNNCCCDKAITNMFKLPQLSPITFFFQKTSALCKCEPGKDSVHKIDKVVCHTFSLGIFFACKTNLVTKKCYYVTSQGGVKRKGQLWLIIATEVFQAH